jgi:hypothetical protein
MFSAGMPVRSGRAEAQRQRADLGRLADRLDAPLLSGRLVKAGQFDAQGRRDVGHALSRAQAVRGRRPGRGPPKNRHPAHHCRKKLPPLHGACLRETGI